VSDGPRFRAKRPHAHSLQLTLKKRLEANQRALLDPDGLTDSIGPGLDLGYSIGTTVQ